MPIEQKQHTPGPWSVIPTNYLVDGRTIRGCHINGDNNRKILCDIVPGRNTDAPTELAFANARLMASAPELLANLAICTRFLELEAEGHRQRGDKAKAESCEGQVKQNLAAIAKATGAER